MCAADCHTFVTEAELEYSLLTMASAVVDLLPFHKPELHEAAALWMPTPGADDR